MTSKTRGITFVANNFYSMHKHSFTLVGKKLITVVVAVTVTVLSSCADNDESHKEDMQTKAMDAEGGDMAMGSGSGRCIDNKPAPTPFSTDLNAINHNIDITQAITMINNFGAVRETMVSAPYNANTLPVYETFNLEAIDQLICQDNAVGFRVYMAMDDQQQVRFVLVGVDGDGKDIIQRTSDETLETMDVSGISTMVMEAGQRWP